MKYDAFCKFILRALYTYYILFKLLFSFHACGSLLIYPIPIVNASAMNLDVDIYKV